MSVDSKRSSGVRSASKKSGASKCAFRFSSRTWTLSARASPTRVPMPTSSTSSFASKGANDPRKVPPAYPISNPTWECTGSSRQEPAGRASCVCVKVLIAASLAVDILDCANNCTGRNVTRQVLIPQASSAVITAWATLLKAHASAKRELSSQLQADHGLTINDYECLLVLSHAEEGAMRRVDIAGEL